MRDTLTRLILNPLTNTLSFAKRYSQHCFNVFSGEVRPLTLILLLIPVFILILYPHVLTPNEENYFQLAHRRVEPAKFSHFNAIFDQTNARIVFEYVLGSLVKTLGYNTAHVVARVALAIFYAFGVGAFLSAMRLPMSHAVTVIAAFFWFDEGLLGAEWLFRGVEAKTLAYAAIFGALGFGVRRRWIPMTILLVIATYFHFLVGGFWILALALLSWTQSKSFLLPLRILGCCFLFTLPLLVVLIVENFAPGQGVELTAKNLNDIHASRVPLNQNAMDIYVALVPFHIAPFYHPFFMQSWATDGLLAAALLVIFLLLRSFRNSNNLVSFVTYLLLYFPIAFLISFFDRNTHVIGRFYLFRPSSLVLFIAIASLIAVFRETLKKEGRFILSVFTFVIGLHFIINLSVGIARRGSLISVVGVEKQQSNLIRAIKENSSGDEIVLLQPSIREMAYPDVSLHRLVPRATLVSEKFVPTHTHDLLLWNELRKFRKDLFRNGCSEKIIYPVRLLVATESKTLDRIQSCGEVVWEGSKKYLVRVDQKWLEGS